MVEAAGLFFTNVINHYQRFDKNNPYHSRRDDDVESPDPGDTYAQLASGQALYAASRLAYKDKRTNPSLSHEIVLDVLRELLERLLETAP